MDDNTPCVVICENCNHTAADHFRKKCHCGCRNFVRKVVTLKEAAKLGVLL